MHQHIGIVACSAEGAALCYRTICIEGAQRLGPHAHPEVSMHTHSLSEYVIHLDRGDTQGVGELILSSARKLAAGGADFLICPDNTIHQAFSYVEPRSPLPWLHIADVLARHAVERGFRRLGITGTRWLVDSNVYPDKLAGRGLDFMRPTATERDETNRIIMDELVYGVFKPESIAYFAGDRTDESRRLRCHRARMHRNPPDYQRREFTAANARLHAPAGKGGVAPGDKG